VILINTASKYNFISELLVVPVLCSSIQCCI